jgi:hypothetical protein
MVDQVIKTQEQATVFIQRLVLDLGVMIFSITSVASHLRLYRFRDLNVFKPITY